MIAVTDLAAIIGLVGLGFSLGLLVWVLFDWSFRGDTW